MTALARGFVHHRRGFDAGSVRWWFGNGCNSLAEDGHAGYRRRLLKVKPEANCSDDCDRNKRGKQKAKRLSGGWIGGGGGGWGTSLSHADFHVLSHCAEKALVGQG